MKKTINILNADLGLLMLRIATGGLMVFHGINKLVNGHDYIIELLQQKGLPQFLWIGVPLTEVFAPILMVFGVFSRISGMGIAVVMLISMLLAHSSDALSVSEYGGIVAELNLLYMFAGLAIFFTGPGKYTVNSPKRQIFE